jgi:hypothetical protein
MPMVLWSTQYRLIASNAEARLSSAKVDLAGCVAGCTPRYSLSSPSKDNNNNNSDSNSNSDSNNLDPRHGQSREPMSKLATPARAPCPFGSSSVRVPNGFEYIYYVQ